MILICVNFFLHLCFPLKITLFLEDRRSHTHECNKSCCRKCETGSTLQISFKGPDIQLLEMYIYYLCFRKLNLIDRILHEICMSRVQTSKALHIHFKKSDMNIYHLHPKSVSWSNDFVCRPFVNTSFN